jgi:primosomal protein N' (replication factor Y)
LGLGTERLEKALIKHFPQENIIRIDRDNTRRKNSLQEILHQIHSGKGRILVGTQMLTKGHHFPEVTLVGIINADNYLFSSDFRASERLGQLIIQVAGRAGRAEKPGEVFIQTHHPTHPLLLQLIKEGYSSFAKILLRERTETRLPPLTYMALLRAEAVSQTAPFTFLTEVTKEIRSLNLSKLNLLGPIPAPMEKKAGRYRAHLLIQSSHRKSLHNLIQQLLQRIDNFKTQRKVRWSLDIDPLEIF